jgi:hypothetical protein
VGVWHEMHRQLRLGRRPREQKHGKNADVFHGGNYFNSVFKLVYKNTIYDHLGLLHRCVLHPRTPHVPPPFVS